MKLVLLTLIFILSCGKEVTEQNNDGTTTTYRRGWFGHRSHRRHHRGNYGHGGSHGGGHHLIDYKICADLQGQEALDCNDAFAKISQDVEVKNEE